MIMTPDPLRKLLYNPGGQPGLLLDLTLWYAWHRRQGTLPAQWQGRSMIQIAAELGSTAWVVVRPWRVETPGIQVLKKEDAEERSITYETSAGTLTSRWSLGPDGDWWQTDYPVTRADQMPAALSLIQARSYVLDEAVLTRAVAEGGQEAIVAIEIPRRPYSDLLHDFLGWGEGLMLMYEQPDVINEMLDLLEEKLHDLIVELVELPGPVILSPDNLDGQFISPRAFDQYLGPSYEDTAEELHAEGKQLWVHAGGPISRLLAGLADAGVDAVEGVCGPPQGDTPLAEARRAAGPNLILWGGVPQDALLLTHDEAAFADAVSQAARDALAARRAIIGVADHVPVDADPARLRELSQLLSRPGR